MTRIVSVEVPSASIYLDVDTEEDLPPPGPTPPPRPSVVLLRGAGDLATGVSHVLTTAGCRCVHTELPEPLAIRRTVAFSEAVYGTPVTVEGITAVRAESVTEIRRAWSDGHVPVLVDPGAEIRHALRPDVFVDAAIAKRNLGTDVSFAPLVIALGPGFTAGADCHCVVETQRGHHLGRIHRTGSALPDTGTPAPVAGVAEARVARAPHYGRFQGALPIGAAVAEGDVLGHVDDTPVRAGATGALRGILSSGRHVPANLKLADVDPRGVPEAARTISDKARALGGAVLTAILAAQSPRGGSAP